MGAECGRTIFEVQAALDKEGSQFPWIGTVKTIGFTNFGTIFLGSSDGIRKGFDSIGEITLNAVCVWIVWIIVIVRGVTAGATWATGTSLRVIRIIGIVRIVRTFGWCGSFRWRSDRR